MHFAVNTWRSRAGLVYLLCLVSVFAVPPTASAEVERLSDEEVQPPKGWIRTFAHTPHETPNRLAIAETLDGATKARLIPELAKALSKRNISLDKAGSGEQPTLLFSASRRDGREARNRDPLFQIAPPREANLPNPQLQPAINLNRPRPQPAEGPSLLVEIHVLTPMGMRLWSGYAEASLPKKPGSLNHPTDETALGAAMIAGLLSRLGMNAIEDDARFTFAAD